MLSYMSRTASGLAAGALVFLLAYRGGTVMRFAMRDRVDSPELSAIPFTPSWLTSARFTISAQTAVKVRRCTTTQ